MEASTLNIQQLPDEMTLNIFKKLDEKSLSSAIEVCSKWSSLISSSALGDIFELKVDILRDNYEAHHRKVGFMYRNICISKYSSHATEIPQNFLDFLGSTAENVQKITLNNMHAVHVMKILKMLPNVKEVKIHAATSFCFRHYQPSTDKSQNIDLLELPGIQTLMINGAQDIMKNLKCQNLTTLEICDIDTEDGNMEVNQLLKTSPNLKHLELRIFKYNLRLDYEHFEFKLDTLVLDKVKICYESLVRFLFFQKPSLKKLAVDIKDLKDCALNFILFSMNLRELEIDSRWMPKNFSDARKSSIKKLTIWDTTRRSYVPKFNRRPNIPDNIETADKVIKCCPSLESITIYDEYDLLATISQHVPQLRVLKLTNFSDVISPAHNLDNLCHLEVNSIRSKENFKNLTFFVSCAKNLKSFKVYDLFESVFDETCFIGALQKSEKLETVCLAMRGEFTTSVLEAIRDLKAKGRPLFEFLLISDDFCFWKICKISKNFNGKFEFSFETQKMYKKGYENCQLKGFQITPINRKFELSEMRKIELSR